MDQSEPQPKPIILIADDEEAIRKLLSHAFDAAGFQILTAANGLEALRICKEEKVDVIVTDLVMPQKEGIEMIRILRKDYPALKIVAMSGWFADTGLRAAKILGADAVVAKPLHLPTLVGTVRSLLEE